MGAGRHTTGWPIANADGRSWHHQLPGSRCNGQSAVHASTGERAPAAHDISRSRLASFTAAAGTTLAGAILSGSVADDWRRHPPS
jgi:hypothetical protein